MIVVLQALSGGRTHKINGDRHRLQRRQSVALRNRLPVTSAITFSTTVPIAKDIHAYNLL
jgi:hypothetical protein